MRRLKNFSILFLSFLMVFSLCETFLSAINISENRDLKVRVYGRVIDYNTNEPIRCAKICILNQSFWVLGTEEIIWPENYRENLLTIAEADSSGTFEILIERSSLLRNPILFAYWDDEATPGIEYVPSYKLLRDINSSEYYLEFILTPGASINLTGNPFFDPNELFFSYEILDDWMRRI
ncbi:MAG: hypothetical protein QXU81_00530 [Candidatus Bathyarchaeia archaeon]